ncbi:MAG: hypothetical protein WDW36_007240 [Sanguina aurantia]
MLLYHEKQVAALCGVHAINALLQGPYFSEVDLGQIAQELDALEKQFMQEGGVASEDYLKFMSEESGNVDASGMFSIQVLSKALQALNLQVTPLDNPELASAKAEPQHESAFICNLQEHWFAVRKLEGAWWNLNSLFPAPQPLSELYLATFLATLKGEGYTIFLVQGQLPQPQPGKAGSQDGAGRWWSEEQSRVANEVAAGARQRGRAMNAMETAFSRADPGGALQLRSRNRAGPSRSQGVLDEEEEGDAESDADLQAAIRASLMSDSGLGSGGTAGGGSSSSPSRASRSAPVQQQHPQQQQQQPPLQLGSAADAAATLLEEDEDRDFQAAIQASLMHERGGGGDSGGSGGMNGEHDDDGDGRETSSEKADEGRAALSEEPSEGAVGVVALAVRLPDGGRVARRFHTHDKCSSVYDFIALEHGLTSHVLSTQFPRKDLSDDETTLQEAGITSRSLLNVEAKRS